jgi:hypothetical protein
VTLLAPALVGLGLSDSDLLTTLKIVSTDTIASVLWSRPLIFFIGAGLAGITGWVIGLVIEQRWEEEESLLGDFMIISIAIGVVIGILGGIVGGLVGDIEGGVAISATFGTVEGLGVSIMIGMIVGITKVREIDGITIVYFNSLIIIIKNLLLVLFFSVMAGGILGIISLNIAISTTGGIAKIVLLPVRIALVCAIILGIALRPLLWKHGSLIVILIFSAFFIGSSRWFVGVTFASIALLSFYNLLFYPIQAIYNRFLLF